MTTKPTTEEKLGLAARTRTAYLRICNHPEAEGMALAFMEGVLKAMAEDPVDSHDHTTVKFICELFAEACNRQTTSR